MQSPKSDKSLNGLCCTITIPIREILEASEIYIFYVLLFILSLVL